MRRWTLAPGQALHLPEPPHPPEERDGAWFDTPDGALRRVSARLLGMESATGWSWTLWLAAAERPIRARTAVGSADALGPSRLRTALHQLTQGAPLAPVVAVRSETRWHPHPNGGRVEVTRHRAPSLPHVPDPVVETIGWMGVQPRDVRVLRRQLSLTSAADDPHRAVLRAAGHDGDHGPSLASGADAGAALASLILHRFRRMAELQPVVLAAEGAEGAEALHAWRVALRVCRALLSELGERGRAWPAPLVRRLARRWRRLQAWTGPWRDLDVASAEPPQGLTHTDARAWLTAARERAVHRGRARLLRRWEAWLGSLHRDLAELPPSNLPIGPLARLRIAAVATGFFRDARAVDDHTPLDTLHDLRKQAKRLRYLIDQHASLLPGKPARTLVKVVKGIQDVLGQLQDQCAQMALLARCRPELPHAEAEIDAALSAVSAAIASTRVRFTAVFQAFDVPDTHHALEALTGCAPRPPR